MRILILAPTGKDAVLAKTVFDRAGMESVNCLSLAALCSELDKGAGVILLTEEAIEPDRKSTLDAWLNRQPPWSDLPVLILSRPGADSAAVAQAMELMGNVTVLERPIRLAALVSAARAALRGRMRQYQTREHLLERKRGETEREQLLESERAARLAAEQAGRLKDDFLAMVSHELRTPLNCILGWAQLLNRPARADESIGEGLCAIERSAKMQAQLINDLLDMNRIVSGKLHLEMQAVDAAPMIDAAVDMIRHDAALKHIQIQEDVERVSGPIRGDPTRLQQVVWNLLSNAVKFTPEEGTVRILLKDAGPEAEISVIDSGIGIDARFLPHVFERFRQADSSSIRQHGGLGLGLAIVKEIVELHGGAVSVESEGAGEGSTFRVRLPIATESGFLRPQDGAAGNSDGEEVGLAGIRILVVDDDLDACDIMKRLLSGFEATVETAHSGGEALDHISQSHPDLLLCDVGMPTMDGYSVIRTVRERRLSFPAIAVTAFARPEDRLRALAAGFDLHLAKPIESRALLMAVKSLIRPQP